MECLRYKNMLINGSAPKRVPTRSKIVKDYPSGTLVRRLGQILVLDPCNLCNLRFHCLAAER